MNITQKAVAITVCLFKVSQKHNKHYCFPSQLKILELMKVNRTLEISRATLNRYLRIMEDQKFIHRIRRHHRDNKLGMVFRSTLYFITKKGLYMLMNFGVNVKNALKRILEKEENRKIKPEDRRTPESNGIDKKGNGLVEWVKKKTKLPKLSILWNL